MKKEELEKLGKEMYTSWEPYEKATSNEWKTLLAMVKKMLGKKGEFYFNEDVLFVCYDGGRHPEYNSNVFSEVNGVYKKGNKLYVSIEDDDMYPIERLNIFELHDIADAMCKELVELS